MTTSIQPAPHAIIFDFDGTLADTFPLIVSSWNASMSDALGRHLEPHEVVARFGIPDEAMLRRELATLPDFQGDADAIVEAYHAHYEREHAIVAPFAGVEEMLRALRDRKLGLMTGKGRRTARISLRQLGWNNLFGSVVTGDDTSLDEQKPHPAGILQAAQELQVEAQHCVYIGDSPADILAGRAAGMTTIVAGWHTFYGERLRATNPDFWADSPHQIIQLCAGET